jgi:poly(rC)-binding protein 2/3/4
VGEIKAARDAVLEVTSRLRSYIYRDLLQRDTVPPSDPLPGVEASSSNNMVTVAATATTNQNVRSMAVADAPKVLFCQIYLQNYPSLFM